MPVASSDWLTALLSSYSTPLTITLPKPVTEPSAIPLPPLPTPDTEMPPPQANKNQTVSHTITNRKTCVGWKKAMLMTRSLRCCRF